MIRGSASQPSRWLLWKFSTTTNSCGMMPAPVLSWTSSNKPVSRQSHPHRSGVPRDPWKRIARSQAIRTRNPGIRSVVLDRKRSCGKPSRRSSQSRQQLVVVEIKSLEMHESRQQSGARSLRSSTVVKRGAPSSTARWGAGLETHARMLIYAWSADSHTRGMAITA